MKATSSYQMLEDDLKDDDVEETFEPSRTVIKIRRQNYAYAAAGFALGLLLSLLYSLILSSNKDVCIKETNTWSPALEAYAGNDKLSLQRFNVALRTPNKFRGPPSQDIDDAWEEITYPKGGLVRLSKDQLDRVNASVFAAEYTEEMGGGYIAGIEVFHQLHCVNMLRQATYMEYYDKLNAEWKDQETLRYHLDHCVDMLRQKLMCDPDVGMFTYVWVKGFKQAFPDFHTVHKCRSYDKILNWAHENFIHGINVADLRRAPGALERETRP